MSCWEEPVACEPDPIETTCGTRECGSKINNCGTSVDCPPDDCVGEYGEGYVCDGTGTCVLEEDCIDTCISLEYECGTHTICGVETACPDTCEPTIEECVTGTCVSFCGGESDYRGAAA